jgi:hypothetical protein
MTPAASRLVTLSQYFGVALILTAPFAVMVGRRVLRDAAARRAMRAPVPEAASEAKPDPLAAAVAAITEASATLAAGEELRVALPGPTDRIPIDIRDAIVSDAAARAGLEICARADDAVICRRVDPATPAKNPGISPGGPRE